MPYGYPPGCLKGPCGNPVADILAQECYFLATYEGVPSNLDCDCITCGTGCLGTSGQSWPGLCNLSPELIPQGTPILSDTTGVLYESTQQLYAVIYDVQPRGYCPGYVNGVPTTSRCIVTAGPNSVPLDPYKLYVPAAFQSSILPMSRNMSDYNVGAAFVECTFLTHNTSGLTRNLTTFSLNAQPATLNLRIMGTGSGMDGIGLLDLTVFVPSTKPYIMGLATRSTFYYNGIGALYAAVSDYNIVGNCLQLGSAMDCYAPTH